MSPRAVDDVRLDSADFRVWRQGVLKQVGSIPAAATRDCYHIHYCLVDVDDVRAVDRVPSWVGKMGRSSLLARRRRRGTGATRRTCSTHGFESPAERPTMKSAQQREADFLEGWWLVVGVELVVAFRSEIQEGCTSNSSPCGDHYQKRSQQRHTRVSGTITDASATRRSQSRGIDASRLSSSKT